MSGKHTNNVEFWECRMTWDMMRNQFQYSVVMEVGDLSAAHSYFADKHDFPLQLSGVAMGSLLQQFSK